MSESNSFSQFLRTPFTTFFSLWLPILFSMVAEPMTGLVDTAFVSRLGTDQLAALGIGTVVMTSGLWLFNFLSVGCQTSVAQASGKSDTAQGARVTSLALALAALLGTMTGLLAFFFAADIADIMGAPGSVAQYSIDYITYRSAGGPAVLITMASFGALYGVADMRSPLLIALLVNILNILLDWLLIFGPGPFPAMGISGSAIASSLSQWLGALCCLYLIQQRFGLSTNFSSVDLTTLLKIGRDMFLRTGSLILFMVLATREANRLGPETGAAHQAVRQAWIFTAMFLDASAITGQSIIGYFYGSGDIAKARKVALLVCRWGLLVGASLLILMLSGTNLAASLLLPPPAISIFTSAWVVAALIQPVAALAFATDGIHWGTGDYRYLRNVVVASTGCSILLLLLMAALGYSHLTTIWGITGIWIILRAICGILRIWPGIGGAPLAKNTAT